MCFVWLQEVEGGLRARIIAVQRKGVPSTDGRGRFGQLTLKSRCPKGNRQETWQGSYRAILLTVWRFGGFLSNSEALAVT